MFENLWSKGPAKGAGGGRGTIGEKIYKDFLFRSDNGRFIEGSDVELIDDDEEDA